MQWGTKKVISIGGGKGGVGKSSFAANLACRIAAHDRSVLLVDADLGGANLHTMVGIRYPEVTLEDFLNGRQPDLQSAILQTPIEKVSLLSSASDILGISAPNFRERERLYRGIRNTPHDAVIFDIAAGSQTRAIDFFSLAPTGIIVIEPVPTSLENAFTFLKNLLLRVLLRLFFQDKTTRDFIENVSDPRSQHKYLQISELVDQLAFIDRAKIDRYHQIFEPASFQLFIVVNAVKNQTQQGVGDNFIKIVRRYLGLSGKVLATLPFEESMDASISRRTPICRLLPECGYSHAVDQAVRTLDAGGHI